MVLLPTQEVAPRGQAGTESIWSPVEKLHPLMSAAVQTAAWLPFSLYIFSLSSMSYVVCRHREDASMGNAEDSDFSTLHNSFAWSQHEVR